MTFLNLSRAQYLELEKIGIGAFHPLTAFMNEDTFWSVLDKMRLCDGSPFPLPVLLDVDQAEKDRIGSNAKVELHFANQLVGYLDAESFFQVDRDAAARKIFGTDDNAHPGVSRFRDLKPWFVGGEVTLLSRATLSFSSFEITPQETKRIFEKRGWRSVVGFQTRNIPHRAHEYLHRIALEIADGLFLQPLVGQKRAGDFTPEAVLTGYRTLIDGFLPRSRVLLGILSTSMRYAGPREAVFHAIIRRNYGCTHFIVGRDHAGVGNYYGLYDAHALTLEFDGELGIEILRLMGPFYSEKCQSVTTKTCPEELIGTDDTVEISGTKIRRMLVAGEPVDPRMIRPEIVAALHGTDLFIEESEE
jgi:sulfate adenylyltransferase